MSDLYEQLKGILTGGFSTMALMEAPYIVRKIVNLMLRNRGQMTYEELLDALGKVPEENRSSREEIDEALDVLGQLGWMKKKEENNIIIYQITTDS